MQVRRILLVGGGRRHLEVLWRFARKPDAGIGLTLANPDARCPYSAMLPAIVAGHRSVAASQVDLPALTRWARAQFVRDSAVGLDLYARIVRLAKGGVLPFDLLSLDIGSAFSPAVPGVLEHALSLHPTDRFLAGWRRLEAEAGAGDVRSIAVVGGGAAAVEILLAMHYRLAGTARGRAPRFALITDAPHVLHEHTPAVRKQLGTILIARNVDVYTGSTVTAVEPGAVVTATGQRIAADRVVWAMPAAGEPWLAASSLACDSGGLVRVNASFQSVSDPFVFAVGDCATRDGATASNRRGSALTHGEALAANLRHASRGEPVVPVRPRRRGLSVITTGPRHAVASWGPVMCEGKRVWRWRDRVDRKSLARYDPPRPKAEAPIRAQ